MKKLTAILVIGILTAGILFVSSTSDQLVDAGSRKKIHFTETITSSQDPGQGHENHQLALLKIIDIPHFSCYITVYTLTSEGRFDAPASGSRRS